MGYPAQCVAAPSATSPQLRRRPSFRQRFWTKPGAKCCGGDDDDNSASSLCHEPQSAAAARTRAYVPVNAASGFTRTVTVPRESPWRGNLAAMSEHEEEENAAGAAAPAVVAQATVLPQVPEAGHLYFHPEPGPEADDYAAFLAAAEVEDRARRVVERRGGIAIGASTTKRRDSGYYSSSGGREREPHALPPPLATAKAPRTLRRQQSIRAFGQRIAEYIKPVK